MQSFAQAVASWQLAAGRLDLPWQKFSSPYERLVSEVMLQQTQVDTVIPYFQRFLEKFPTVEALAEAAEDDVFALWAGLGYYTRAANLRKAARYVVEELHGCFPTDAEGLLALPGVGPSTAAAVAAFTSGEAKHPMIDGNVKRVLSRVFLIDGRIGEKSFEKAVAERAYRELPESEIISPYTQGLMDLGSGVCKRTKPLCDACPVAQMCRARRTSDPSQYPGKRLPPKRTEMRVALAFVVDQRGVWLQKINRSIWKGLWTPPCGMWSASEVSEAKIEVFLSELRGEVGSAHIESERSLSVFSHDLTHRRLYVEPYVFLVKGLEILTGCEHFAFEALPGVPKPVAAVLSQLALD